MKGQLKDLGDKGLTNTKQGTTSKTTTVNPAPSAINPKFAGKATPKTRSPKK